MKLFVADIDNTIFDWVKYYVGAFSALLREVEKVTHVPYAQLAKECKDVFATHGSIEYPFLIQELPSVMRFYRIGLGDIDGGGPDVDSQRIEKMLREAVTRGRDAFLREAEKGLRLYDGVEATLAAFHAKHPKVPLVALTDAPRYVAMWKLNKLGVLQHFDAVYGLADPRIPTCGGRIKVDQEILIKHLQRNDFGFKGKIRTLPEDYEKPGTKGLKTVLMDYDLDEDPALRAQVLWIGDNERKDVGLGKRLGVKTFWARYGVADPALLARLHEFSPEQNIHKHASTPEHAGQGGHADVVLDDFRELIRHF